MTTGPKDNRELLSALVHAFSAVSPDTATEADLELKAEGLVPRDVGDRFEELARGLLNKRRLSWQDSARRRLERMRSQVSRVEVSTDLNRGELIERIRAARADPRLAAHTLFRKRNPEEATLEELRELLEEVEKARILADLEREPSEE